ncbi:probable ribokinase at N-terminal half [Coccomyxa sp. Obi]|nr:probable ribokinase at N-terminal half [Coccomyxa sp. Obi]
MHQSRQAYEHKVVGVGSCGLDYLAQVASFPKPDDKLRTENLQTQGGGNCANALTAASRLGLRPLLITKIGDDAVGDGIVKELENDGVNTDFVLRAKGSPSPFTYIIVDREGGTRTCIHTPAAPLAPDDLSASRIDEALSGAALVYFDGRLAEAALQVAKAARSAGIPILVEAERLRPGLNELLAHADYVVTSTRFPKAWTGEESLGDSLLSTFQRLPHVRWMITTLGAQGSVFLEHVDALQDKDRIPTAKLDDVLKHLNNTVRQNTEKCVDDSPACSAASGAEIRVGQSAATEGPMFLEWTRDESTLSEVRQRADAAAAAAAISNADSASASQYNRTGSTAERADQLPVARVIVASAARIPKVAIVDTTGAGDAFIGTMLYAICNGMPPQESLRLAAVVAATKCTAVGARTGLPYRDALCAHII